MYEAVSNGVRITVAPRYLDQESRPEEQRYFFAYTVEIANLTPEPMQLLRRYWCITDGLGRVQEVRGDGVVGEQPEIGPGDSFSYTSGCPLETPDGTMQGHFEMLRADGSLFRADIPAFSLDSPHVRRSVH